MEDIIFMGTIAGVAALFILDRARRRAGKAAGEAGSVVFKKPQDQQ